MTREVKMYEEFREMDAKQTLEQIGGMTVMGISGGRIGALYNAEGEVVGIELPVASGYKVRVLLAANDTYTVQRVMVRSGKTFNKGEMTNVYCDDLSETCWDASCFRNVDFGKELVNA